MRLFNLAVRRTARRVEELAQHVAQTSEAAVRERLSRPLSEMNVDQRRGYIRARAVKVVAQEAALAAAKRHVSDVDLNKVTEVALERLVARIVVSPTATPLRRAA